MMNRTYMDAVHDAGVLISKTASVNEARSKKGDFIKKWVDKFIESSKNGFFGPATPDEISSYETNLSNSYDRFIKSAAPIYDLANLARLAKQS